MRKLFPIISLVILIGTVAGCSTGNSTAKPDPTDSTTQPAKEEFDAIAAEFNANKVYNGKKFTPSSEEYEDCQVGINADKFVLI